MGNKHNVKMFNPISNEGNPSQNDPHQNGYNQRQQMGRSWNPPTLVQLLWKTL